MSRSNVTRQPREGAATGSDVEPCVPAGSPIHDSTDSPQGRRLSPAADVIGTTVPPTPAEILLGAAMWLAAERDALGDDLTLTRSRLGLEEGEAEESAATVALPLASLERLHRGLARTVALLDGLAIDPTKVCAGLMADPSAGPTAPTARALQ